MHQPWRTTGLPEVEVIREDSARGVLCADVDAMFATIEALERGLGPEVPILVGGAPEERGVVSTASYAARRFGCHSAMPMAQAQRLCPQALRFPPRHELYSQYSRAIMDVLRTFGPLEQTSIDEAYVEVGAVGVDAKLGQAAKSAVRQATRLTISIGLSANKLVSKVASGYQKPDGLTVISPGDEAAFLAPLEVGRLGGVGPKTRTRLSELGVSTCADLVALPLDTLISSFGPAAGQALFAHARGQDDSPIVTQHDRKQISQETTFVRDVVDRARLWSTLRELSDEVGHRLSEREVLARTVTLKLRYADFRLITRSTSLILATDDGATIARATGRLMRDHWERGKPVRLIGVGATRLVPGQSWLQLPLPWPD